MISKTLIRKMGGLINDPWKIIKALSRRNIFNWLPVKAYLKLLYRASFHNHLNLHHPNTFNEKLQWLKIYDRQPRYTQLVDKYEVRQYITNTIGNEYLIPLMGVWEKFDDIDFSKLPKEFVLKCTHDSGGVVICKDKSQLDIAAVRKKLNRCLKFNYYYHGREWPYKNIKPRIICEQYLVDETEMELIDYKLMCFNGKVKCFFVCLNRNSPGGLNIDIYDTNWNIMPFCRTNHPNSGVQIPKPKNYNKMIEFAEKLSKNIPFLRVDFYEANAWLYFGELTFFPGSGFHQFTPDSYDYLLGSWLVLSEPADRGNQICG